MKKFNKVISKILIVFMISACFPYTVFGEVNAKDLVKNTEIISEGKIIKEIVEKREKNVKHFLKDDGSFEAVIYNEPVHYLENGQWKDIDNTLQEVNVTDFFKDKSIKGIGSKVFTIKQNDYKVAIDKNADSKSLVNIEKGQYKLSWNVEKAKNSKVIIDTIDEKKLRDKIEEEVERASSKLKDVENLKEIKEILKGNEEKKTLRNVSSGVTYEDVFDNADLQYIINGDKVKENIIINK